MEVMLFQFCRHGNPRDGATTNFFPDFKRSISGLSSKVSFVSGFYYGRWLKEAKSLAVNLGVPKFDLHSEVVLGVL